MALTYDNLRSRIGHKAGYGATVSSWSSDQSANVELILKSALSRFFDLMILPGEREKHMWSFLTPTLPYTLLSGQWAYDLPAQFVSFEGPLIHAPGATDWYPPIEIRGAEEVMKRLAESDDSSKPLIAGVRVKAGQEIDATQWELIVWPVPDTDYAVKAATRINPTIPGADDAVPLGGQPHDHTLICACIAETIALLVDEGDGGQSEARFIEALRSSVSHDRQVSRAKNLGYNGDPSNHASVKAQWFEDANIPAVTYLGQSW